MTGLRLTWVQPEDLLGHELRQAGQDALIKGSEVGSYSVKGLGSTASSSRRSRARARR